MQKQTDTAMDAHLFRLFCQTSLPLLQGARIEKIQEPAPGLLAISVYSQGHKRQFFFRFGRKDSFCFAGQHRLAANRPPSAPIMRIRRYFADKRIAAAVCQFCSRRLWLMAANANLAGTAADQKTVWLCLDLKDGPSLRFLEEGEQPEPDEPNWPEAGTLAAAMADWRSWTVLTPALRKTLRLLDEPEGMALLQDLQQGHGDVFLYTDSDAEITLALAWPLPAELARNLGEIQRDDIAAALSDAGQSLVLGKLARDRQTALLKPAQKRIRQLGKLLDKLAADEQKFNKMAACAGEARRLQNNLWRWRKDAKEKTLILPDDGRELALDDRFSIAENMARMFHAAKRARRGLEKIAARRQELADELLALKNLDAAHAPEIAPQVENGPGNSQEPAPKSGAARTLLALQKTLPKNVQAYAGQDGYIYLRGKDAKGNRAMRKYASPHDLWAHVASGPGAHVIILRQNPGIEVPDTTLDEAGALAAAKSWLCAAANADVVFAELRHVKPVKGAPDGKVVYDKVYQSRRVPVEPDIESRLTGMATK